MDGQWYHEAYKKILLSLNRKAEIGLWLYRKEPWDCFMIHLGETDTVAHHFWKFYDPSSPRYCHADDSRSSAVRDMYIHVDKVIGEFMENLWENTSVMLISDHGFGGIGDRAISINQWLSEEGFLCLNKQSSLLGKGLAFSRQWGLKHFPASIQEKVFRSPAQRLAQRMESSTRFSGIAWEKTIAFSEDLNYFPTIHINLCGREPKGTVSPGREYNNICEKIIDKILSWKDLETGVSIVRQAWRREEVYTGPYVELAPDIILDLDIPHNYSFLCLPHGHFKPGEAYRKLPGEEMRGVRSMSMSGSHRPEGLFLFSGEQLSPQEKNPAHITIQDVCPTVLSVLGISPSVDMDGYSLLSSENNVAAKQIIPSQDTLSTTTVPYTANQGQKVKDKLQHLGYLE
jgi:predicted AlkP superfamily phosphohydrolase/phosphomutase